MRLSIRHCIGASSLNLTVFCCRDKKAMKGLEGSVKDMKGEGFFAADIKMPTGDAKKAQVFINSSNSAWYQSPVLAVKGVRNTHYEISSH